MSEKICRFCKNLLKHSFCDLGNHPLSNAFLLHGNLTQPERCYPLHAYVCHHCFLVQLEAFESPVTIFNDYAYFSSYSDTWKEHTQKYAETIINRFNIHSGQQVIEIASNDGCLLRHFADKKISILGIEPAANVAQVAEASGIPTLIKFFGVKTANDLLHKGVQADLLVGNNVLAHVPKLDDFLQGLKILLKPQGVMTLEFPHLLNLIKNNQFDTIYHEHFSYFSLLTVEKIFVAYELELFDVEEISTHGGSLRIYAKHKEDTSKKIESRIHDLEKKESAFGLDRLEVYQTFQQKAIRAKKDLLEFFNETQKQGKKVVGYGAPAKGNTLLNFCQIGKNLMAYTVDRSPHKQGRYLPGTQIPIMQPNSISQTKPDYLFILPWNVKEEIMQQMSHIRSWGGKFVIPLPTLEVV